MLHETKAKRESHGDMFFSVCAYRTEALIVSGSMVTSSSVEAKSRRCQQYSIADDKWSRLPNLNEARATHSSCTFAARYILVFGGITDDYRHLNSFERLDMMDRKKWELIPFSLASMP